MRKRGLSIAERLARDSRRDPVEVDHLWLGTNDDNVADKIAKGRQSRKGPQGQAHPKAKVTDDQVRAIRIDFRPLKTVAKQYGLSIRNTSAIRNRETWTHLP